jgi:hypothetical protein
MGGTPFAISSSPRASTTAGSADGASVRTARQLDRYPPFVRILSVVGTRPQLIKAAALTPVLRARHEEILVDTGQHYDEAMAGIFFAELGLPRPDHSLGVAGGSHGVQTGNMLAGLEPIVVALRPDAVLVYGDTNSTLAGALTAAKLNIPVAHVEAGLRSFDRRMPEEVNRVVTDHLSHWLFAPTPAAVDNLAREGVTDGVEFVGDLMQDLAARVLQEIRDPDALATGRLSELALESGGYLFSTIHRAENRSASWVPGFPTRGRRVADVTRERGVPLTFVGLPPATRSDSQRWRRPGARRRPRRHGESRRWGEHDRPTTTRHRHDDDGDDEREQRHPPLRRTF